MGYRLMPAFDPANDHHVHIAALARGAREIAQSAVAKDDYLNDPNRALHVHRTRLRDKLFAKGAVCELEFLCSAALVTTAFGEDTE